MPEQLNIGIEGMRCASCSLKVETALKELEGVIAATANFAAGSASITYQVKPPELSAIKKAVEIAGYKVIKAEDVEKQKEATAIKERNLLIASALLSAPVFVLGMAGING